MSSFQDSCYHLWKGSWGWKLISCHFFYQFFLVWRRSSWHKLEQNMCSLFTLHIVELHVVNESKLCDACQEISSPSHPIPFTIHYLQSPLSLPLDSWSPWREMPTYLIILHFSFTQMATPPANLPFSCYYQIHALFKLCFVCNQVTCWGDGYFWQDPIFYQANELQTQRPNYY